MLKYIFGGAAAVLVWCTVILAPIVNHVLWCIDKAEETGSAIALLIVGLLIFPVGWVHGIALWMGNTWI